MVVYNLLTVQSVLIIFIRVWNVLNLQVKCAKTILLHYFTTALCSRVFKANCHVFPIPGMNFTIKT